MKLKTNKRSPKTRRSSRARVEPLETRFLLSASPTVQLSLTATPAVTVSGSPSSLSPAMIEQAYDLNNIVFSTGGHAVSANGAGETIAIVDAFGDPNISSDLQTFDANFGISNNNAQGQFALTVATPEGAVATNAGWATEISLDVEWAHAIAPGASILLVEANSATVAALTTAVAWAASQSGVVAVSMSWGDSPEFSSETSYDHIFTTPGVTFVAASGDDGLPNYPSTSPEVLAVGGTTLNVDSSGNWLSETPWNDSGGGVSPYERTNKPDVAYDGSPATGFLVYDSIASGGNVGWQDVGGTSAGSPQWASMIAIVDQGRALRGLPSLTGYTQTIPEILALPSSDFNPIIGSGLTGLGSPIGEKVIAALVGGGITVGAPAQLAFAQQPTNVTDGGAITPAVTVNVEDAAGDIVTSDNSNVTIFVSNGPGNLGGALTVAAVNGVATFSNLSLNTPGSYTLGASDGSLAGATSASFTVAAPQLVFIQQPANQLENLAISPAIKVAIENASGNVITSDNSDVTIFLASGSGNLGGTLTVAAVNGIATFTDLSLDVAGNYAFGVSDGSDTGATSTGFTIAAPVLVFTRQPTTTVAGFAISPTITVSIENSSGAVVTADNSNVTLSVASGPGSLGGTLTVAAVNGVATFRNIAIDTPGAYTLSARSGSSTKTSGSFTIEPPGWVDTANMNEITGWAYDPANPNASINIEVVIQGGPAQTFSADQTRLDLQAVLGSSNHGFVYATPVLSAGSHTAYIYAVESNGSKMLLATKTLLSQNSLFDEHYYLQTNPIVAAEVAAGEFATGYDQYIQVGQYEGLSPSPYWDEAYYLQVNPDVAAAVKSHAVSSGFMHFYLYGQYENRPGVLYFNPSFYLQNNADVSAAVTSGAIASAFEHFVLYGQYEGRSPMKYFSAAVYDANNQDIRPFVTGETTSSTFEQFVEYGQYEGRLASNFYNEGTYLADNPDVAAAVRAGIFPDGFQHWLMYGQFEGRTAV